MYNKFTPNGKPTYKQLHKEIKDAPRVVFTRKALRWIKAMVSQHSTEVGWYHVVEEIEGGYIIKDLYYPKHDLMTGSTCEISAEGETAIMNYMVDNGKDDDISKLRCWGHSHVNMSTNPSHQDETQAVKLLERNNEYLIRIIVNKANVIGVSILDVSKNVIFENLPFEVESSDVDLTAKYNKIVNIMKTVDGNNISNVLKDVHTEIGRDELYEGVVERVNKLKEDNEPPKSVITTPYGYNHNIHNIHNIHKSYGNPGKNSWKDSRFDDVYGREDISNYKSKTQEPSSVVIEYPTDGGYDEEEGIIDIQSCTRFQLETYLGDIPLGESFDIGELYLLRESGLITEDEFGDSTLTQMFDVTGVTIDFKFVNRRALEEYLIDQNESEPHNLDVLFTTGDLVKLMSRNIISADEYSNRKLIRIPKEKTEVENSADTLTEKKVDPKK